MKKIAWMFLLLVLVSGMGVGMIGCRHWWHHHGHHHFAYSYNYDSR